MYILYIVFEGERLKTTNDSVDIIHVSEYLCNSSLLDWIGPSGNELIFLVASDMTMRDKGAERFETTESSARRDKSSSAILSARKLPPSRDRCADKHTCMR